ECNFLVVSDAAVDTNIGYETRFSCSSHLMVTVAKLLGPCGVRSMVAQSLLVEHQLPVLNRLRERATNLLPVDHAVVGKSGHP
ncbi:MAG: hypothetical protein RLN70_06025, partial [Rhodospirillaceae bacterium]